MKWDMRIQKEQDKSGTSHGRGVSMSHGVSSQRMQLLSMIMMILSSGCVGLREG